jgi:hypothetical protein
MCNLTARQIKVANISRVVLGAFFIMTMNGCLYLWGNIAPYVLSYFYLHGATSLTLQNTVSVMPLMATVMMVLTTVSVVITKYGFPVQATVLIGALISASGAFLASFMTSWSSFKLVYGVIVPIGFGLCYYPPLLCGWEWVPERRGMITGLVVGAFGFGAFTFGFVCYGSVNPNNEMPITLSDGNTMYGPDIAENVPLMLKRMSIAWVFLGVGSSLCLRRNPDFVAKEESETFGQLDFLQAVKTGAFWRIFFMIFFSLVPAFYIS